MPQQDIMPLPAKKEDILPLERYEEENVFENATWITRFLLQFGLTRWDELNDSIKKNPDYARDMAKSFIRKVNKELNGDDADEEPNEEQEEVEEEKQVEEPPKPKRKRGRPPKNKNKKDKTKKKNEEQECAGKSIIPEILTAVEELSKKVDEELGGLWKKQEDQTELLEGLPKKIATDQAILEAKIDAIATMVAPELFSTPGTPFYSENDDPEDE